MPYITIKLARPYTKRSWKELFQQDASRLVLRIGKSLDKESAFNLADSLLKGICGRRVESLYAVQICSPLKTIIWISFWKKDPRKMVGLPEYRCGLLERSFVH